MNAAFIWTVLASIGVLGAIRNVIRRHQNVKALMVRDIDGPALLTAQAFRNSEGLRLVQAVIGVGIGVAGIWFYQSDYARHLEEIRQHTLLLQEPTALVVYRNAIQYGLIVWQLCLVVNIWYFGIIGDRAEALRRKVAAENALKRKEVS